MRFHVRVTPNDPEASEHVLLARAFEAVRASYVICEEVASHVHWHCAVTADVKSIASLRYHLQKHWRTNAHLAIREVKTDDAWAGCCAYCCKGSACHPQSRGDPPVVRGNEGIEWTIADVARWHEVYWARSARTKSKTGPRPSMVERVIGTMTQNGVPFTAGNVTREVLAAYRSDVKAVNTFQVEAVIVGILNVKNSRYRVSLEKELTDRIVLKANGRYQEAREDSTSVYYEEAGSLDPLECFAQPGEQQGV